jgi:hypothetical protein
MAVLSERDAKTWHTLAGRVAAVLELRLDRRVLANRARTMGQDWRPEPLGAAFRRARRLRGVLLRAGPVLLRTDVAAFYPSVTPEVLARSLRRFGVDPDDAHLAATMLEGWGSDGYPGLPIGPPGSAILANSVLGRVDLALRPFPWLRWVDDYLIAARSEGHASRLLDRIDESLGRLGLARAPGKTLLVSTLGSPWPGPCSLGKPLSA